MKSKTKAFDCVEMKRRGAALVYEKLKSMSQEEQIDYWRRRTGELRKEQEKARARLQESARG